ncbi:hypothetical protein TSOC_007004 [Tetrabaena socialis]|uniref:Uncharacterized protein n=1 Tax=Tetrabaena socialis TaxID=47790 RepID=A0A2J8A280_9CHLO|nr:hypothetical protein TSOC_007004 [Tetrabaena socialis]|eukprot:PNH06620.1 hypothetical protein TSOC_007004 [Tetrabaena socialis]
MEALIAQASKLYSEHGAELLEPVLASMRPVTEPVYSAHLVFQQFLNTSHNLIGPMAWERQAAALAGLSLSQLRFTLALFSSVFLAAGVRLFWNPTVRHLYSLAVGVFIIYYPFGSGIVTVLPMAVAPYLALLLAPRRAGSIAWWTVFPYLLYLHVVNASGESWKTGNMDFTGVPCSGAMLPRVPRAQSRGEEGGGAGGVLEGTFKLEAPPVVLGYVQTSDRPATISLYMTLRPRLAAPAGELDERITSGEQEAVNRHAQKWLAGLLGRPECRSRVLKVMAVDADGAAVILCRYVSPTPLPPALARLGAAGGNAAEAGGVEALMLKTARFVAHVAVIICVIGLVYQLRYYFSWKVTEAAYIMSGLDFIGWDAKSGKAQCIPSGPSSPSQVRMAERPAEGQAEGMIIYKAESYLPERVRNSLLLRLVKILWTTFVLNYMACSFQLLDFKASMQAYASVYYFPYILMLVVNVAGSFLKAKKSPKPPPPASAKAGPSANGHASTKSS